MNPQSKIYLAGHAGLVGSALEKKLRKEGFSNILTRSHKDLDLTRQEAVESFFEKERPDSVFLAAAKVGGIHANHTYPADFIFQNLAIQNHVIQAAHRAQSVKKFLFLGSSCIYPRECPQPMKEESLLSGPLEATNEPYAIAKIAGIKMCESYSRQYGERFIAVMPTNLYGPNDNHDLETSHVIPALIRKFHEAKRESSPSVTLWGTGVARREFLHVDDLADACVFLMNRDELPLFSLINVGSGEDQTILELAKLIQSIVGYTGEIVFDRTRPDGTPQKLLDVTKMKRLGWTKKISLREGLAATYESYRVLHPYR